jgi:hypothetical protein
MENRYVLGAVGLLPPAFILVVSNIMGVNMLTVRTLGHPH